MTKSEEPTGHVVTSAEEPVVPVEQHAVPVAEPVVPVAKHAEADEVPAKVSHDEGPPTVVLETSSPDKYPLEEQLSERHSRSDRGGVDTRDGLTVGATAAAPPWQRGRTVPIDHGKHSWMLHGGEPVPARAGGTPRGDTPGHADVPPHEDMPVTAKDHPMGKVYGSSTGVDSVPTASPNRYGHPVSQPLNSPSGQRTGQDFSQPTVRFGGQTPTTPTPPQPSATPRIRPTRIPRRASLQLRHLEPWSVLKISLVLSVAGFLAWMGAVGILYGVLEGMGVWDQVNGTYSDLTSVSEAEEGGELISAGGVFGVAALVGMVNIVLITAMCTVGAFIYNASADLAGGVEITLSERD